MDEAEVTKKPVVFVGVPCLNSMTTVFTSKSIMELYGIKEAVVHVSFLIDMYIHEARNQLVRDAQKKNATHIFFLDSDMSLAEGTLSRLLSHNLDIVGCNYNMRSLPKRSTVRLEGGEHEFHYAKIDDDCVDLFRCSGLGAGALLVNMKVFDVLPKPWFFYDYYPETDSFLGEDLYFCRNARKMGFDIWCDPIIKTGHIGQYTY